MPGEKVNVTDSTRHLGIVRNTSGRADVKDKIMLGRKTAYTLSTITLAFIVFSSPEPKAQGEVL